ncbi:MAG: hypothetical protein K5771_08850 [Oscillospiraceae bacterium]|nr:hypothetical protein [Oscillospiraceae bacterium]
MSKKEKQNIVLFLIEGDSEIEALEFPFSELVAQYDDSNNFTVFFLKKKEKDEDEEDGGGDITSQGGINPGNIERIITKLYVKSYMEKYKFYPKYIRHVFHIIDLDGAYLEEDHIKPIKPEHIYRDKKGKIKLYYNAEEGIIEAPVIEDAVSRNLNKSKNIDYLTSLNKISIESKSVLYHAFYFASNLDHFINNNANMHSGKTEAAEAFSMNYVSDIDGFCSFFCNDPDATKETDYSLSWEEVKTSPHSVQRHTNINLLIDLIKNGGI